MRLLNRWLYAGFLLLAPALALAAFACPPTIARAETGADKTYHPALPSIKNEPTEAAPKATAPTKGDRGPKPKNDGEADEEAPAETATAPGGEPESRERHKAPPATPGEGGGHPPAGGNPREGPSPKAAARPRPAGATQPEKVPTKIDTAEAGGGSSPVVPILIVTAVLAALSIGAVIYRGRRGDPHTAA